MGEVLGIASSITALIENIVTVIKHLKDVKNAPKERDDFLMELQHLEVCLISLELTIQRSTKDNLWLRTLDRLQDMFKEFLELLDGFKIKLKAGSSRLKKFLRRMDWTMTKESVMEDLGRIARFRNFILFAELKDSLLTLVIQETLDDIEDHVDDILENTEVVPARYPC
ncbi:hypothetical protein IW261DRAFT_1427010 [Armillaria novae-zelandiae]|uniref:Uncharacterized protein n=1 Tax=Armillaria novae-zelandiae TaxID=153914 RepID=A0AA39TP81_9AGAR|nr:hypothetical protein IW261DRAFT_1427010 [Armillaria novae-zelandiae]